MKTIYSRWHFLNHRLLQFSILLLQTFPFAHGFYLPGVAPTSYSWEDRVPLHVNHLTPAESDYDSQVHSAFSLEYYRNDFHFCRPKDGPKYESESLGSILFGDRIQTSPYDIRLGINETCKAACGPQFFSADDGKFVNAHIIQDYNVNWFVDGLPAGQFKQDTATGEVYESPGFPLGSLYDGMPVLNNHHDILIDYHEYSPGKYRVVGVTVLAESSSSTRASEDGKGAECNSDLPMILSESNSTEVLYTYSVYWYSSPTSFATRWDRYLNVYDPRIHWFSLVNSTVIVIVLVGMVSTILLRTLRKDIARYNRLDDFMFDDFSSNGVIDDGVQEDSGWKLVHGDIFRPPKASIILSALVGNGTQLLGMTGLTIIFAMLGFLSPSNRGLLSTVMILFYILFSFVGGYTSSRVYKFWKGDNAKKLAFYTPILLPGIVFFSFFLMNLLVWANQASGAVPFSTMLVLIGLWFTLSLPLSLAGSWVGWKSKDIRPSTRTNQIPRQIPPCSDYLRPFPSAMLVGVLPFGAIFVELYFILRSIWFSKFYYMFGFLFVCYALMMITCAAVTILMMYFLLCSENYHWQWRSFYSSGFTAFYVFGYAMLYWIRTMSFANWTSCILYFGYSMLISLLFFVLTGTIGYIASWVFILKIYASIKVD